MFPGYFYLCKMSLLELLNDMLRCICDFSGTALCSHVSTRLWNFRDINVGNSGAEALVGLKDAGILHSLTLDLWNNNLGDSGAQALAGLKNAAALRSLTLNLTHNNVGDSGAEGEP